MCKYSPYHLVSSAHWRCRELQCIVYEDTATNHDAQSGKGFCDGSGQGKCVLSGEAKHLGKDTTTKYGNEFGGKCVCHAALCADRAMKNSVCRCNQESQHSANTRKTFEAPTDIKNAQAGLKGLTSSSGGSAGSGGRAGSAFAEFDKKQKAQEKKAAEEQASKKSKVSYLGKMMGYKHRRMV